jgi:hypothetical protein
MVRPHRLCPFNANIMRTFLVLLVLICLVADTTQELSSFVATEER